LQQLLNTLLRILNFMNASTKKGAAVGFSFDTVRTLDKVQPQQKYSILYFAVKTIKENDPTKLNFLDHYKDIHKAMRYNIPDFDKQRQELVKNIGAIEMEAQNCQKAVLAYENISEKADERILFQKFIDHFSPFLEFAKGRIEEMNDMVDKIQHKAEKCAEYYGLASTFPPEAFLNLISQLVDMVARNVALLKREEENRRKRLELEARQKNPRDKVPARQLQAPERARGRPTRVTVNRKIESTGPAPEGQPRLIEPLDRSDRTRRAEVRRPAPNIPSKYRKKAEESRNEARQESPGRREGSPQTRGLQEAQGRMYQEPQTDAKKPRVSKYQQENMSKSRRGLKK
jgi:hypothetical protein